MSRQLYDFLNDSFLFDRKHLENEYAKINDDEIEQELQRYRDHVISNSEELHNGLEISDSALSIYFDTSSRSHPSSALLKQCALYYDNAVVDDPLFKLTLPETELGENMKSFLGFESDGISRIQLARAVSFLFQIRPMVAGSYVNVTPISRELEPPEVIPIRFSDSLFADSIPESLLSWFQERALVSPLRKYEKGGWYSVPTDELEPCRAISVDFQNYDQTAIYFLAETKVNSLDEDTGIVTFEQRMPDYPPEPRQFLAWVTQSINQVSGRVLRHLATDLKYAYLAHSTLLTQSQFVADLLNVQYGVERSVESDIANLSLQLNLPIIDHVSIEDLMKIRNQEGEAFKRFRTYLGSSLRDLRHIESEVELKSRLRDVEHELLNVQVQEVETEVRRIKREAFGELAFGVASLLAAIPTGGQSIIGTILAAMGGYNTMTRYLHEAKGHPAYFLWRLNPKN